MPVTGWTPLSPIVYGTPLSGAQLNATSSVAGTFVYSPTNGVVLPAGTNALAATPPGGLVTMTAQTLGRRWEVVIEDEGPGLADAELARVFERFVDRLVAVGELDVLAHQCDFDGRFFPANFFDHLFPITPIHKLSKLKIKPRKSKR